MIFFYQIALGGMFALAGTPFHEIERGFYKSTAGVLYFIALLGFFGKCVFYVQAFSEPISLALGFEIFFHSAFIMAFTGYMISLWGERQVFRARSFAATVLTGLAGLLCTTASFSSAPLLSVETVIYPVAFFLSSLLLGGVTVGMLIGHWYLIDTGQSLEPFIRIYKFFIYALCRAMPVLSACRTAVISGRKRCQCHGTRASLATPFHVAHHPAHGRASRTADFIMDDLAHVENSPHDGGNRIILYRAVGGFCRRDFGPADSRAHRSAVLVSLASAELNDRF